jgi:flagellar biosynthesis/type III secretory pathway M-ring protein FliF/YscJ
VSQSQLKTIHAVGDVQQLNVSVVLDQTTVDPTQIDAIRTALSTAAGVDTQNRGDQIAVTAIPFNNTELVQQQAAANDASQQAQILTYAHLAALVLGPILLLVALRFVIGRGKAKEGPKTASSPRANEAAAAPVAPVAPRPRPVAAQPPVDPERAHVHDQIQQLASSNPGTLASLIQTWIEEDRGN